jgi:CheY-like chemotaxis protein
MTDTGPASAHARKTVLIVDDDQGTLRVLENGIGTILDMFDVLTASNGREAVEHLERGRVDALVTDLAMPVMDGFALIAYVTNLKRALPVVVLSGLAASDIGERLAPFGGLRVLAKPASYQDVADALLKALEHVALGHVEGIPLSGVLQLVESERRSCTVVVTSGRRKGRLSFQSGVLIDAFSDDFGADGEAAAYDILGWDDTSIAFEHLPDNVRRTIHTPMQLMLIEVAVTQDAVRERTERSIPPAVESSPSLHVPDASSAAGEAQTDTHALSDPDPTQPRGRIGCGRAGPRRRPPRRS